MRRKDPGRKLLPASGALIFTGVSLMVAGGMLLVPLLYNSLAEFWSFVGAGFLLVVVGVLAVVAGIRQTLPSAAVYRGVLLMYVYAALVMGIVNIVMVQQAGCVVPCNLVRHTGCQVEPEIGFTQQTCGHRLFTTIALAAGGILLPCFLIGSGVTATANSNLEDVKDVLEREVQQGLLSAEAEGQYDEQGFEYDPAYKHASDERFHGYDPSYDQGYPESDDQGYPESYDQGYPQSYDQGYPQTAAGDYYDDQGLEQGEY